MANIAGAARRFDLPAKRIVAFSGNPLSKRMGVLGEYPPDVMLAELDTAVQAWEAADPATPVQPALRLIAVTAQGTPGKDGMYRLRMDTALIEKVYGWAKEHHAMLFLDVQVGRGCHPTGAARDCMPFLSRPDVHLADGSRVLDALRQGRHRARQEDRPVGTSKDVN